VTGRGPVVAPAAHYCPVKQCRQQVEGLVCRGHWHAIPKALRDRVWRTWRSGAGCTAPAHLAAVRAAIDSVSMQEARAR
jgi:hypothetical protein